MYVIHTYVRTYTPISYIHIYDKYIQTNIFIHVYVCIYVMYICMMYIYCKALNASCYILYTGSALCNDVWRSDDLGVTWVRSTLQASWAVRKGMSAVYTGGTIVFMGGHGEDICGYILICIHVYAYYIRMYTSV